MLLLDSYYSIFLAGVPEDLNVPADMDPVVTVPFVGCMRDVIIETEVAKFNAVPHLGEGIQLGQCPVESGADSSATGEDDQLDPTSDNTDQGRKHQFYLSL